MVWELMETVFEPMGCPAFDLLPFAPRHWADFVLNQRCFFQKIQAGLRLFGFYCQMKRRRKKDSGPSDLKRFGPRDLLLAWFQRFFLALHLFRKNELTNHAGAGAFFFLLSVPPVFLLLLFAFDQYLIAYPRASDDFFLFLSKIHPNLDKAFWVKIGLLNLKTKAFGFLGLLNILWAGRAILTAVQRGLEIIFPSDAKRPTLIQNAVSLGILSLFLFASVLFTFVSYGAGVFLEAFSQTSLARILNVSVVPLAVVFLPFVALLWVIYATFRYIPSRKPGRAAALAGAGLFTAFITVLHALYSQILQAARITAIYGVLGSLILLVILVYFAFVLYFFCAQLTFVLEKADVLILDRMYFFRFSNNPGKDWMGRFLFRHPARLLHKYARHLSPGQVLFKKGEASKKIYFVFMGVIGIYEEDEKEGRLLAQIREGEVFGEMAWLLGKRRSATAAALTESMLLVVPPDIFEELVQVNPVFSLDLIRSLSDRLRKTGGKQQS